jgi:hypothetical protein
VIDAKVANLGEIQSNQDYEPRVPYYEHEARGASEQSVYK